MPEDNGAKFKMLEFSAKLNFQTSNIASVFLNRT